MQESEVSLHAKILDSKILGDWVNCEWLVKAKKEMNQNEKANIILPEYYDKGKIRVVVSVQNNIW